MVMVIRAVAIQFLDGDVKFAKVDGDGEFQTVMRKLSLPESAHPQYVWLCLQ